MKTNRNSIAGNMLIYILGAIFLMGLLIVALKGSFQEGSGIDPEKTGLLVGQVQRYGAELERGVQYVLRNGYSETDIRFGHPNTPSYGLITDVPARQVFAPEGGGAEWRVVPSAIQTTLSPAYFTGGVTATGVGSTCATANCADLTYAIPYVTKDFCLAINNAVGIVNPTGDAPVEPDGYVFTVPYNGTFSGGSYVNTTGNYTDGKMEGCIKTSAGNYHYYRVLLAR